MMPAAGQGRASSVQLPCHAVLIIHTCSSSTRCCSCLPQGQRLGLRLVMNHGALRGVHSMCRREGRTCGCTLLCSSPPAFWSGTCMLGQGGECPPTRLDTRPCSAPPDSVTLPPALALQSCGASASASSCPSQRLDPSGWTQVGGAGGRGAAQHMPPRLHCCRCCCCCCCPAAAAHTAAAHTAAAAALLLLLPLPRLPCCVPAQVCGSSHASPAAAPRLRHSPRPAQLRVCRRRRLHLPAARVLCTLHRAGGVLWHR